MPKKKTTKNPYERKTKRAKAKRTKAATAFPASANTPGQDESIKAFAAFEEHHEHCTWWDDYVYLRESEGRTWREAAYIAWAATPKVKRWPATLLEFAQRVLGMQSDKVIYKWRKNDPSIDKRVETFGVEALQRYLADVIDAWVTVASTPDPSAYNDRRMYLEKMGIYVQRSAMDLTGRFNVDNLDAIIERELAQLASGSQAGTAAETGDAQQQPAD